MVSGASRRGYFTGGGRGSRLLQVRTYAEALQSRIWQMTSLLTGPVRVRSTEGVP